MYMELKLVIRVQNHAFWIACAAKTLVLAITILSLTVALVLLLPHTLLIHVHVDVVITQLNQSSYEQLVHVKDLL